MNQVRAVIESTFLSNEIQSIALHCQKFFYLSQPSTINVFTRCYTIIVLELLDKIGNAEPIFLGEFIHFEGLL